MGARLKSDIDGALRQQMAVGIAHRSNGIDLGMSLSPLAVIPLSYHPTVSHDDGTDHRVWRHASITKSGNLERARHILFVYIHKFHTFVTAKPTEMNDQTVSQTIADMRRRLAAKFDKGEIDAFVRITFRHVLHYETVDILLHKDSVLSGFIVGKISKVVDELLKNRPIQYIFGQTYFCGHTFKVDESTLIPRQETEELVDLIVDHNKQPDLAVLDCGTGSGCIAISLALALKFAQVDAIDISDGALAVARENAQLLKAKVSFTKRDILTLSGDNEKYDIIVSNPPYIADSERATMEANVLDYEPATALFVPDSDPLQFYRAIAEYGTTALKPDGRLYFEINSRFPEETKEMLKTLGYTDIEIINDISRRPRFATAKKGGDRW